MKRSIIALSLVMSMPVHAQEFFTMYGSGVQHQINTHSSLYGTRFSEYKFPVGKSYTEILLGDCISYQGEGMNRSYKSVMIGEQYEYKYGVFFVNVSGGAALVVRTADGPSTTVTPYGSLWIGMKNKNASIAFGTWSIARPRLEDEWTGNHWGTSSFTGLRIGINMDVKVISE